MTPRERYDGGDKDERDSWRAGPSGGRASNSPDDFDAPEDEQQQASNTQPRDQRLDASPDDFDDIEGPARLPGQNGPVHKTLHTELQDKLGDAYEVIFEAEGLQIRRLGDRAFIAEYIPDKQILRAGPHILFSNQRQERHEKLRKQGQERLQEGLAEWKEFGFEPTEEGHLMMMESGRPNIFGRGVPRYIQPMAKKVDSVDEVAEAIQWVRSHRRFD